MLHHVDVDLSRVCLLRPGWLARRSDNNNLHGLNPKISSIRKQKLIQLDLRRLVLHLRSSEWLQVVGEGALARTIWFDQYSTLTPSFML